MTDLYVQARDERLPLQALVAEFHLLSLGYGPGFPLLASAGDRLRADLVLALAIVHHLVFTEALTFDQIISGLAVFTRDALLVEFVPPDDQYVSSWHPERRPWYTLENFLLGLRREFARVEVLPSYPEPRVLVLCRRG